MNKKLLLVIGGIIVAGGLVFTGIKVVDNKDKGSDESSTTKVSTADTASSTETKKSTSTTVADACKVFNASEISSALGVTLSDGSSDGYKPMTNSDGLQNVQCEWEENGGDDVNEYSVHLDVYNFSSEEHAKTDMDNSRVTGGTLSNEDISGVADDAMFARSGSGPKYVQSAIYWRSGSTVYHMSAVKLDGVDRPAVETALKMLVDSKF